MMQEVEWKWQLDVAGYQAWRSYCWQRFGPPCDIAQCNRFFDTAERHLRQRLMSVRLRRNGQHVVMTTKRHLGQHQGQHRQEEHEMALNACCWQAVGAHDWAGGQEQTSGDDKRANAAALLPLTPAVLGAIGRHTLMCLGGFDNHRLEWRVSDVHIALDQTCFGHQGPTDYEIELELTGDDFDHQHWTDVAHQIGVPPVPQERTKLERYLAVGRG